MVRIGVFVFLVLVPFLLSCLWDRDTLAEEMKGRVDVTKVIAGWFDRNPPEYYLMRLDRVLKELEVNPQQLDLYDDGAVALDRLHRSDEAIQLIGKKKVVMDAQRKDRPDDPLLENHQYRYLANLGTFYAHRWIGLPREERITDLGDLRMAEQLITEAIELNEGAHFGREKYQFEMINLLLGKDNSLSVLEIVGDIPSTKNRDLETVLPDQTVEGLSGMVYLGAAWQSVDIYHLIARALQVEGRSHVSFLANLRVKELLEEGRESLRSDSDSSRIGSWSGMVQHTDELEDWYRLARDAADERDARRKAYMRSRFARGEHSDTHADFWDDWVEPEFPKELPFSFSRLAPEVRFGVVMGLLVLLWLISFWRRKKRQIA